MNRLDRRLATTLSLLGSFFAALAPSAWGSDQLVCVRNYANIDPSPCETEGTKFQYVIHKEKPDLVVCTSTAPDTYCKHYPVEYEHALTRDEEPICVTDFRQSTGNYCALGLDTFVYVSAAY